jgi:lysophospholipase L1-like esterase
VDAAVTASRRRVRKLLTITMPALVVATLALAASVEAFVRWRWDPFKGSPGFFTGDPVRRQRLTPNYTGWFAGVPVHINTLGFRDDRDYPLDKGSATFRILVLGDSVTFGHGSIAEHTYPALLERKLRAWRPDVDWQVWNLGVPGYNTSQELAYLLQVGPTFKPDLVVVGFFENDVVDNYDVAPPTRTARVVAGAKSLLEKHLYSTELYKRIYLTAAWALSRDDAYRQRIAHLAVEDELLVKLQQVQDLDEQQLTPIDRLSDDEVRALECVGGQKQDPGLIDAIRRNPGYGRWLRAVHQFQALHRSHQYRVVFFLNLVPLVCPDGDWFYDGGSETLNTFFTETFSDGVPTVSTYDELRHRRPSQMPSASAHAIGNTNLVKADVLFHFVRDRITPPAPAR